MTAEPPTSDTVQRPALTPQRSASALKHGLSRWPAAGWCCTWQGFFTVTFLSPNCHGLIPCIQLTDHCCVRWQALSRCSAKQSFQSPAQISTLLRESSSGSGWLSFTSTLFAEVTRRCQILADNWSIKTSLGLTRLVTLKTFTKDARGRKHKRFDLFFRELFDPNSPQCKDKQNLSSCFSTGPTSK